MTRPQPLQRRTAWLEPWLGVAIVLLVWEAAARALGSRDVPTVGDVAGAVSSLTTAGLQTGGDRLLLLGAARASLTNLAIGLGAAVAAGVSLGLLLGSSAKADRLLGGPITLARPIPPSALVPFFIVLLGIGDATTWALVIFAAFFPIFLNTYSAVRGVDPIYVHAAAVLGTPRRRLFMEVILPAALPGVLTGIRIGWQVAWAVLIMAELIVSRGGLGSILLKGEAARREEVVIAGMVVIAVLGLAFDVGFRLLRDRLLRWQAGVVAA
ncbi:MAG: ABC transporter permease [Chloroflexota bacterium]|nr:ABC transporter permease [Chloroflexota bacterium]